MSLYPFCVLCSCWDGEPRCNCEIGKPENVSLIHPELVMATIDHPCSGKCSRFNGEPCNTCLVPDDLDQIVVGSMVVFIGATFNEFVAEVISITKPSTVNDYPASAVLNFPSGYPSFATELSKLRLATALEIAIGHRIDAPRPQVCNEHKPFEDFEAAHCAPKNLPMVVRPEAPVTSQSELNLREKNSRLKVNNKSLKLALAISIASGVVGWML